MSKVPVLKMKAKGSQILSTPPPALFLIRWSGTLRAAFCGTTALLSKLFSLERTAESTKEQLNLCLFYAVNFLHFKLEKTVFPCFCSSKKCFFFIFKSCFLIYFSAYFLYLPTNDHKIFWIRLSVNNFCITETFHMKLMVVNTIVFITHWCYFIF